MGVVRETTKHAVIYFSPPTPSRIDASTWQDMWWGHWASREGTEGQLGRVEDPSALWPPSQLFQVSKAPPTYRFWEIFLVVVPWYVRKQRLHQRNVVLMQWGCICSTYKRLLHVIVYHESVLQTYTRNITFYPLHELFENQSWMLKRDIVQLPCWVQTVQIQGFYPSFDFLTLIPPLGYIKGTVYGYVWITGEYIGYGTVRLLLVRVAPKILYIRCFQVYIYIYIYESYMIYEYMRFFFCMVHRDLLDKSDWRHIEVVLVHLSAVSAVARRFTAMVQKRVPLLRGQGGDVQDVWGFHHWWGALCKSHNLVKPTQCHVRCHDADVWGFVWWTFCPNIVTVQCFNWIQFISIWFSYQIYL